MTTTTDTRTRFVGTFRDDGGQRLRLELEARIEPAQQAARGQTIHHQPIPPGAVELAITGETWRATEAGTRIGRDIVSGGQNLDDLRAVIESGFVPPTVSREDLRLVLAAWERWHLNGMRPGCAHQGETWVCTRDENAAAREVARRIGSDPASVPALVCNTPNGWGIVRELYGPNPYPKRGDECHRCGRNRWDEPTDYCAVSGYRYATAWLFEPVPEAVLADVRRVLG